MRSPQSCIQEADDMVWQSLVLQNVSGCRAHTLQAFDPMKEYHIICTLTKMQVADCECVCAEVGYHNTFDIPNNRTHVYSLCKFVELLSQLERLCLV